ncbi:MAG: hypothetical protein EBQ96_04775 [Proteobacteria bacterium]|nr:hypothetical protein [Pseudomonadota bacterium]
MTSPAHKPIKAPVFVDNAVAAARPEQYIELVIDARKVLGDWKASLLAHELLDSNGFIKGDEDLSESRLEKREVIRTRLAAGQALEKPILGIGIFDNVEIGSGSDVLATLVIEGICELPVHVRKSQSREFDSFKV